MVFPGLRSDRAITDFKEKLSKTHGWDIRKWRKEIEAKGAGPFSAGFELLDLDGGAGWELLW